METLPDTILVMNGIRFKGPLLYYSEEQSDF